MDIGIIGASAAGLYAAILLAKRRPDFRITVIDKNDKAAKKLLATGNGHCNLFNAAFSGKAFNHPEYIDSLLKKHSAESLIETLHELGIATVDKEGLLYPLSYSASAHVRYLVTLAESLRVRFRLGERVTATQKTTVTTDKGKYAFDKLIYAFGGQSQANLGSDGSLFLPLQKRGYQIVKPEPSLCPLKSPDVPKSLFGIRHKCALQLTKNKITLYREIGEILFKKDGLSGIAVMNASSRYEEGAMIQIDLFPAYKESDLIAILLNAYKNNQREFLATLLEKPLEEYVLQKCGLFRKNAVNGSEISIICKVLTSLQFRISGKYDFDSSQVTRGGIDLRNLGEDLQSKIEPRVYFIGECLDIDGLCGGFNLGWTLLSAKVVSEALCNF